MKIVLLFSVCRITYSPSGSKATTVQALFKEMSYSVVNIEKVRMGLTNMLLTNILKMSYYKRHDAIISTFWSEWDVMASYSHSELRRFALSLRRGTGEAYFILQANPGLPVDEFLIAAALHNSDYDPQCSGSRAYQLGELLRLRHNSHELFEIIAERFACEFDFMSWSESDIHYWDTDQLYELLVSNQVTPRISAIVHDRFAAKFIQEDGLGSGAFIEHEKIDGILFVVKLIGYALKRCQDFSFDFSRILFSLDEFKKRSGIEWRSVLEASASGDSDIHAFIDALESYEIDEIKRRGSVTRRLPGMAEVMECLRSKKACRFYRLELSRRDVGIIRTMFMSENDPVIICRLCHVLSKTGGVTDELIPKLAALTDSSDSNVVFAALDALETSKSPNVRRIALAGLEDHPEAFAFLGLLAKHWRRGDERIVLDVFKRSRSPGKRHSIAMAIVDVKRISSPFLKYLYDRTHCGSCRERMVRRFFEMNAVSEDMLNEFLHDGVMEIRDMARRFCAGRGW